jgi:hypothetical protein
LPRFSKATSCASYSRRCPNDNLTRKSSDLFDHGLSKRTPATRRS